MGRNLIGLTLVTVAFLSLFLLQVLPVHAGSTLVQENNGGCKTCSSSTISVSFLSNVVSGDLLVVGVIIGTGGHPAGTVMTISDTLGSTFIQAVSVIGVQTVPIIFIYYATAPSSGADTVSVTFTSLTTHHNLYLYEVAGVLTTPAGTATGTNPAGTATASMSTSTSVSFQAGAFLLGVAASNNGGPATQGSGFTLSSDKSGSDILNAGEWATSGVSSPTNFPMASPQLTNWAEAGIAFDSGAAVGGEILPVDQLRVLLPWLALVAVLGVVGVETFVVHRRKKNQNQLHSCFRLAFWIRVSHLFSPLICTPANSAGVFPFKA